MTDKYSPLPHTPLSEKVTIITPPAHAAAGITHDSPAIEVMTDLSRVQAVTTDSFVSITEANTTMISQGIRLLLVTEQDGSVIGVITASDILGEGPVQYMQKVGCSYSDIQVRDIMTPYASLEALYLVDVERAKVGGVLETLKRVGRQHALVIDVDEETLSQRICGIFSTTHISRLMNQRIEIPDVASNFAEVEIALTH